MGGTELVGSLFSECHKGVEDEWGLCISDPGSWTELKPVVGALLLALVVRGQRLLGSFDLVFMVLIRGFDCRNFRYSAACWNFHSISGCWWTARKGSWYSAPTCSLSEPRSGIIPLLQWG